MGSNIPEMRCRHGIYAFCSLKLSQPPRVANELPTPVFSTPLASLTGNRYRELEQIWRTAFLCSYSYSPLELLETQCGRSQASADAYCILTRAANIEAEDIMSCDEEIIFEEKVYKFHDSTMKTDSFSS
jgi:hypothetical protein